MFTGFTNIMKQCQVDKVNTYRVALASGIDSQFSFSSLCENLCWGQDAPLGEGKYLFKRTKASYKEKLYSTKKIVIKWRSSQYSCEGVCKRIESYFCDTFRRHFTFSLSLIFSFFFLIKRSTSLKSYLCLLLFFIISMSSLLRQHFGVKETIGILNPGRLPPWY